jgi:hypothetical protein
MTIRIALVALALVACAKKSPDPVPAATAATADTGALAFEAADLAGDWTSGCFDPGTGQGTRLDFDLTASDWGIDYQVFGDAACAVPFLTVRIEGPYTLGAPSALVEGARDGEFAFTSKTVTPHSADAAGFLESAYGCGYPGFAEGVAADLADGCPGLGQQPLSTCDRDYDIVWLDGDELRFGLRPADNDMCTEDRRPTELSPLVLTR